MKITTKQKSSKRGFAGMSPERRREIAALGGKSVPDEKWAFSLSQALAARAGKKGGAAVAANKRSFSVNYELAVAAGRKGAAASHASQAAARGNERTD